MSEDYSDIAKKRETDETPEVVAAPETRETNKAPEVVAASVAAEAPEHTEVVSTVKVSEAPVTAAPTEPKEAPEAVATPSALENSNPQQPKQTVPVLSEPKKTDSTALAKVPTIGQQDTRLAKAGTTKRRPLPKRPRAKKGNEGTSASAARQQKSAARAKARPESGASTQTSSQARRQGKPASQAKPKAQAKPVGQAGQLKAKMPKQATKSASHVSQSKSVPQVPQAEEATATSTTSFVDKVKALFERFVAGAKRFFQNPLAFFKQSKRAVIIAVVLIVYIVASLFFSWRYLPGTKIDGTDVSWMSSGAFVKQAETSAKDYAVKVDGKGVNATIQGSEIKFAFDPSSYRDEVTSYLAGWAWPFRLLTTRDYSVSSGVSYDKDVLDDIVSTLVSEANENAVDPVNAAITYDKNTGTFKGNEEQAGTSLSLQKVSEAVNKGVKTIQPTVTIGDAELKQPSMTMGQEEFDQALARANQMTDLNIQLTVQGTPVQEVTADQICSWITIDDQGQVTGDLDAITTWTQSDLSDEVDTVGTYRTYTRPDDSTPVEVAGGSYGWIIDGKKLARIIQSRIVKNSNEPIEIPMSSTAENYVHGKQDWGNRYIDVDLMSQYVRMYGDNGKLIWESDCVSGDISQGQQTITGVYTIQGKESPATLVGLDYDYDGEPDYETDVEYWMPFYGGYGLHDALWRDYFGGDAYQYDGSHGCINLPYYKAQSLYDLIRVGDVVVVHF